MSRKKSPDLAQVFQRPVFLCMFLPFIVLGLTAIGTVGFWGKQTIEKEHLQRARAMARVATHFLDQASRSLDTVARVAETAPSENQAVMQGAWEACGYFDRIYHLDSGGKIRLQVPSDPSYLGLDLFSLPYFKQEKENSLAVSRPFISVHTGNPTVYLTRRLSQGRLVIGALNLGALQDEIMAENNANAWEHSVVFLLDPSGIVLAHPSFDLVRQQSNQGDMEIFRRRRGRDLSLVYEYNGKMVLGSAARVESTGWVAVVQSPLFTALSPFIWTPALILAASFGIWIVLVWNFRKQVNHRFIKPLAQLNRDVDALANSDFDRGKVLADIPGATPELTALWENLQRMADALEVRRTALQESEKGFRSLFERLPVSLFRSTPAGHFLTVNPALVRMMGFPDWETLINTNLVNIYPNPEQREQWRSIAERDGIVRDYEVQMRRFDGTDICIWLTCRAIRDSEGQVLFYEGILEDVTERKKLEEQVRHSRKMEAVGQLAGGVAHDFNNMLSVIMGYAELILLEIDDDDPLRDRIEDIHEAGIRSMELTRQLLAFARKQTINPEILDLNSTLQGMLKLLQRLIGEDIDLLWMPGADLWPVKMDPSQVDQILANLCLNARDAIDGPGKITIETQNIEFDAAYCAEHSGFSPGRYVMLAVSDNGCGMDMSTLDKIFEPFYTTKELGKGTGMGLATVYGIVKQNTGFINVYSETGHGSTFKIYLRRDAAEGEEIKETRPVGSFLTGDATILLVEDEPAALKMTKAMLEKFGYTVLAASSPAEAMRIAEENSDRITLLITDVVMPGMTGRDLAENLILLYPWLKCMFMSGYTSNVIAHQGVLDEGVNFIQKPFSSRELATRISQALNC
ncbi:ATP-binding protein [uncultured Desulfobacter sp.]|uniref:hybrid sensor histidine kinase/response regulator n=1 Tax=uncultured Desulfobacter sp. TaxID=240139 RepID=UPI002AAA91F6|nr:ATP-binding protein [uncultured Desulfobacter sp.]